MNYADAQRSPVDQGQSSPSGSDATAPTIQLPKGGGAVRGIGEKFAANPVTGTGSMSVPIATSPGRSDFGPQLSLSYDSGAGNGPFGFGWSLSLPSITRKTDKGLPQYHDADESDVFILSGAEDLVPVLKPDGNRFEDTTTAPGYAIHRYRPRIEGLFARIERWTRRNDGDIHWRSISKDNILTLYGKDSNARLADPTEPRRVFTWLICETRDDKGNAVLYDYKPEDGTDVDLTRAHERNRGDRDDPRRTANRYLKRIRYGNRVPLLDNAGHRPRFLTAAQILNAGWMFEVVFDYGEHDADRPKPNDTGQWNYRDDPFSSYRAGFEVRTTRLCRRVLMFHHFPEEPGVGNDCLVRSTDFTYSHEQNPADTRNPIFTFVLAVTQSGYKRQNGGYLKRSLPPVEFEYTQPIVQDTVEDVDSASLENLSIRLDGASYQWTDLHGEGIPGILTEQAGAWFYKRNLSPINKDKKVDLAPLERVALKPNLALATGAQFMDLAGDGQPDLVVMDGPMAGLYEHDGDEGWQPFRPFTDRLNRDSRDPNLKFVDLDGDGHADVLITEDDAFVWHPSLAEAGFGPARRLAKALDEEKGPHIVFADGTQSIYLADLSGDGLTDLVRIRNGEICYWPNLGYGRFGAKVTMDNAPWFDHQDQFDHKRIRLADIDGSGATDIIYLHRDGVRLYFNQSGNGWSQPQTLKIFPRVDDVVSIVPTDLLGNGTACLVWSSALPGDARRPMRYVNLMGEQKPHLLVKTVNNLGAETRVHYSPSTRFYLQDKRDGKPWITKLPFPVHVVERVETYDHISRNRFVTRYAYHHGYFDGEEREFRGFGMVEQFDTEEFTALSESDVFPWGDNIEAASHVPPVHTKTWFHTGIYLGRDQVSNYFAGLLDTRDAGEYYPRSRSGDAPADLAAKALLLDDTVLPAGLTLDEEREACRALKGAMLRQEVYALDGTAKEFHPYTVTEQNFTIQRLQERAENRHAVFFTHAREAISYHYERNPADPRTQHAFTLEVDGFGNVRQQAAVAYGRRLGLGPLQGQDKKKQEQLLITYVQNGFTNAIDADDDYRTPLPAQALTFEVTGLRAATDANRFTFGEIAAECNAATLLAYESAPTAGQKQKRLIEHVRTLYRKNDLTDLLPPGVVESLAPPGESYKLAFTPALARKIYVDSGKLNAAELDNVLANEGKYLHSGDHWWIPSGRVFFSPGSTDTPAAELAHARQHFFLPHRVRNPFHTDAIRTESLVSYDAHDLLLLESRDALDNRVTVEANDYRVLQPNLVSDPNRNQTAVVFDVLGMVAGTAVMGKAGENVGDSLAGFVADLTLAQLDAFHDAPDPRSLAPGLLQNATTRVVYDLDRFQRSQHTNPQDPGKWLPPFAATLARETHASDPLPPDGLKIQIGFSYSDGFGREIQKKIQAEPGPLVEDGSVINPRWVGSGWTIFNNKGKPVRQYEPFFSATHRYEFGVQVGVSPILFYDPVERVVATLHPNHTWGKVVFDPWRQESWDVCDTALIADPKTDPDVGDFFRRLRDADYLPTWFAQRQGGALGPHEQTAARKTSLHAATPSVAHLDSLGRTFLTIAHNKFKFSDSPAADPPIEEFHHTRVLFDIEGNQREVIDAKDRIVMRYDYDMLGNIVHQLSMEAGARWMLNDIAGNPLYVWNDRGHTLRSEYDPLRRPLRSFATGADPANPNQELLTDRLVYGEQHPQAEQRNLRGKLYLHLDQAGVVASEANDFKGNPLRASRRIATQYKQALNWDTVDAALPGNATAELDPVALEAALAPQLEADTFRTATAYDALNRPTSITTPDNSVIRHTFNEANLLETVEASLRGAVAPTVFVGHIKYDAKGQRERIEYGNGARTDYTHDPETFRLTRLRTTRLPGLNGLAGQLFNDSAVLQDLSYTYDPAGNITRIADASLRTLFHDNQQVDPVCSYVYDALYRLIEGKGREHIGQSALLLNPPNGNYRDHPFTGASQFGDPQAVRNYTEQYVYDPVGNFEQMIHQAVNGSWTRSYAYLEPSLIEPAKQSNRLSSTTIGATTESYSSNGDGYDAHGNMLRMPHLQQMRWDYKDQLRQVDLGGGGTAYYVYDTSGQRVRKVCEKVPGLTEERIYLGGFEIFRRHGGANSATLERETLHIMDDKQRIALVETRTFGNDDSPAQLIRYQFGNHLGSASLELDHEAQVISYEEYTPYGSTSYQAGRSAAEVSLKRYRYTGMERDEESGLSYHSARYYAPWLARWASPDPSGLESGLNQYLYAFANPVRCSDSNGRDPDDEVEVKTSMRLTKSGRGWIPAKPKIQTELDWSGPSTHGGRQPFTDDQIYGDLKKIKEADEMAATRRLQERFRSKHDPKKQYYLGSNPVTGAQSANSLLPGPSAGMGVHSKEVLDNIDRALIKVTKGNRPLLDTYYLYYAHHELTDSLPWNMSENDYAGATKHGDTDINPHVLKQDTTNFPTDDRDSLLGGTLMHEFSHTPQDDPENPLSEAKAYGVEKFFAERMEDKKRGERIDSLYSGSSVAERRSLYEAYYTMRDLYEVIDRGGPNVQDEQKMVVDYISKDPAAYGSQLRSVISKVSNYYVP